MSKKSVVQISPIRDVQHLTDEQLCAKYDLVIDSTSEVWDTLEERAFADKAEWSIWADQHYQPIESKVKRQRSYYEE